MLKKYLKIGVAAFYSKSSTYIQLDGFSKETRNTFSQSRFSLNGEYGLTANLTVIATIPFLVSQGFENTETVTGNGDYRVDLKYGVLQDKLPISFSLGVDMPLATADNFTMNTGEFPGEINLLTGDGEWNYRGAVAVSKSLSSIPAYASLSGNYNLRTTYTGENENIGTTDFNDQYGAQLQIGYTFFEKLLLQVSTGFQVTNGETRPPVNFVSGDGTAFTFFDFYLSYQICKGWGIA